MGRDIVADVGTTMAYKESVLLLLVAFLCSTKATCSVRSSEEKAEAKDAANYKPECIAALENQVRIEFEAWLQLLVELQLQRWHRLQLQQIACHGIHHIRNHHIHNRHNRIHHSLHIHSRH